MKKPVRITLVVIALIGAGVASAESDQPGYRKDQRMWLTSVERKSLGLQNEMVEITVNQNRELAELRREHEKEIADLQAKRDEASSLGFPFITDSKGDYDDKIKEVGLEFIDDVEAVQAQYDDKFAAVTTELMTALAQSPNDELAGKKESVRLGSASHHNIEVFNAITNLQSIVRSMNDELRASPGNLSLAIETYARQISLLGAVVAMCDIFAQRIDTHYIPELDNLLDRQARLYKATKKGDSRFAKSELQKLDYAREMLRGNKPKLMEMKAWAARQRERLAVEIDALNMLERNASFLNDAAGFVAEINTSFAQLKVDPPTIIEYDLVDTDLTLDISE